MLTRRSLTTGIFAALPLVAAAKLPPANNLERYVAFLAHEHWTALMERDRDVWARVPKERHQPPMFWLPEDEMVKSIVAQGSPSRRAARVMAAAGL